MTRWQPYTEWMAKIRFAQILETLLWPLTPSEVPVRSLGSSSPRPSVWRRNGRRSRRTR
jgi:hypothetical protein